MCEEDVTVEGEHPCVGVMMGVLQGGCSMETSINVMHVHVHVHDT